MGRIQRRRKHRQEYDDVAESGLRTAELVHRGSTLGPAYAGHRGQSVSQMSQLMMIVFILKSTSAQTDETLTEFRILYKSQLGMGHSVVSGKIAKTKAYCCG